MNNIVILIVEDELIIAKNTAKKLTNLGYTVDRIVSSGEAALDYVNQKKPDLILMDIAIKGDMDGIDTAIEIKQIADIPVIFLTAYANEETLERATHSGCYGYLIKPFREKELEATIKMCLSKYREQSMIQKSLQDIINEYSVHFDNVYVNELTSLPNKLFLRDSFDYLTSLITGNSDELIQNDTSIEMQINLIAVFNICIDRFYKIDNSLNQQQKNTLIQEIAHRLSQFIDKCDYAGIAIYLTEDSFLIMIPVDKQIRATQYGQNILQKIREAFYIDNQEIFISASIGISFYPNDSQDLDELLEQSAKATSYAQKQGGNRCQLFTFAFNVRNTQATKNLSMEAELHHALKNKELELYYQPKVDLHENRVVGAEALLRWNHPTLGRITADKFITLAEESGLMKPIGNWVLKQACRQTKIWHNQGLTNFRVGVNISGFQFKQSDLFNTITQVLFNTSLDPQCLELELTEKILVENIKTNIQRLQLIKKLGIKISLDDFGTGYASLGYLQQFPFDLLKIDASFVRDINTNQVNAVIVENIIRMAHQLGLKVVAEGVETPLELEYLKKYNCDQFQGFYYSLPLEARKFKASIASITNALLTAAS